MVLPLNRTVPRCHKACIRVVMTMHASFAQQDSSLVPRTTHEGSNDSARISAPFCGRTTMWFRQTRSLLSCLRQRMMAFIVTTTSSSPTTAKDDCIQKMACSDISGTALTPKELSEERTLDKFVQKLEQGFTFASLMLHLNSNFSTTSGLIGESAKDVLNRLKSHKNFQGLAQYITRTQILELCNRMSMDQGASELGVTKKDLQDVLGRLGMDWRAPSGRKWKVLTEDQTQACKEDMNLTTIPEFQVLQKLLGKKILNSRHGSSRVQVELSETEFESCLLSNACIRTKSFIQVMCVNSQGKQISVTTFMPMFDTATTSRVDLETDGQDKYSPLNKTTHRNGSDMCSILNTGPRTINMNPNAALNLSVQPHARRKRGTNSMSFVPTAFMQYKSAAEHNFADLTPNHIGSSCLLDLLDILPLSIATTAQECNKPASVTIGQVVEMKQHTSKKNCLHKFWRLKLTNNYGSFITVFLHGNASDCLKTQPILNTSVKIVAMRNLNFVGAPGSKFNYSSYSLNRSQDITVLLRSSNTEGSQTRSPERNRGTGPRAINSDMHLGNAQSHKIATTLRQDSDNPTYLPAQLHENIFQDDFGFTDCFESSVNCSDEDADSSTTSQLNLQDKNETTALLNGQSQIFGFPKAVCLFGKDCVEHSSHVRSEWIVFDYETNTQIQIHGKASKDRFSNLDLYNPILTSFHHINYKDSTSLQLQSAGFACCNTCHQEHERDMIWQRASIPMDHSKLPTKLSECVHIRTVRAFYTAGLEYQSLSDVYSLIAREAKQFKDCDVKRTHIWSCMKANVIDDIHMCDAPKRDIFQLCLDKFIPDGQRFRLLQIGYPGTDYFGLVLNGRMATAQQAHCIVCDSNNCPHAQYVRSSGGLKQIWTRPSSDDFIDVMNTHCDPFHGESLKVYGSSKERIPEMIPAAVRLKEKTTTKLRAKHQNKIATAEKRTREYEESITWLSGYGTDNDDSDTASMVSVAETGTDVSSDLDGRGCLESLKCSSQKENDSIANNVESVSKSSENQEEPDDKASPQYLRFKQDWHRMPDGSRRVLGSRLNAQHTTPCNEGCETTPSTNDASSKQESGHVPTPTLYKVFHVSSVFLLPVQGDINSYDGSSDDLIHARGDIFFTYEFLAVFIQMLLVSSTTFHAYMRVTLSHYVSCFQKQKTLTVEDTGLYVYLAAALEAIETRTSVPAVLVHFRESVLDFITLQRIDYAVGFKCACQNCSIGSSIGGATRLIYDNACNLLVFSLTREPSMVKRYAFYVDSFHHKGHTNCSPFLRHSSDVLTGFRNSSTNEIKNRLHKYMKRVSAFLNQPHFLVLFRHVAYLINQAQRALNDINLASAPDSGRQESSVQTIVCDGVTVNLSSKHVRLNGRPHTVPDIHASTRVARLVLQDQRCLITLKTARKGLHEILSAITLPLGCIAKDHKNAKNISSLVDWLLSADGQFMSPFISIQECAHGDTDDGAWSLFFPESIRSGYKNEYVKVLRSWATQTPEVGIMKPEGHASISSFLNSIPQMNEDTLFTPEQESQMGNIYDLKSHCPAIYFLLHSGAAIWNNDLLKLLRQMLQISRPEWVENEECEPRMHPRSDTHQEPKKSKQEHRNIPVSSPCPQMSPLQESGNQRNVNSFRCPTTFEDFIWNGEYFPNHPVVRHVRRYAMDEEANGRVKTARSRKKQDGLCTKHAPTFRGFSPGVFTVYCAGCSIMLGFSLIDQCESVRTAFEIFFCRNFHYSPLSP